MSRSAHEGEKIEPGQVTSPGQAIDLPRLRLVQLELLCEFAKVCDALGLKFFAIAGTALGAVRHGGFIPWDDDIDLGMTRVDFETLIRESPGVLDSRFFLQHHSTDPLFPLPMAKLRREGSLFVEAAADSVAVHQGIFIDVFPLDRKPRSRSLQRVHSMAINTMTRLTRVRSGYSLNTNKRIAPLMIALVRTALRMVPGRLLHATQDRVLRRFEASAGPFTIAGGSYGYGRESFDPAWLADLKVLKFESVQIPVFTRVEAYLTQLYGNYMTLPPPEARVSPHGPLEVKFP